MAEFLVKRQKSRTDPDPVKHRAGIYERGDIVVAMPDGWIWGLDEHPLTSSDNPPHFFIVKIPGVTVEQSKKYLEPEYDDVNPELVLTRRLWKIRADDVPQWVKDSIQNTGEVTVTWNQIKTFIRNKKTGLDET